MSRRRSTTLTRVAIVAAFLFGAVAIGAALIPSKPNGVECGSLVSPDWTEEQVDEFQDKAGDVSDFGGYGAAARSIASDARSYGRACEEARSTRTIVAGGAAGLAIVTPLALFFVAGSRREDETP